MLLAFTRREIKGSSSYNEGEILLEIIWASVFQIQKNWILFFYGDKYFCIIFGYIAFSGTQLPGKLKEERILFYLKLYQKSFAMDWITSPQNSHIEALNFCCYFKMEPLGSEVIKFTWGHVGGVLPVGSVSL